MKTLWCAETATEAYIDTVKAVKEGRLEESEAAELVAAMAAGYRAQVIVEAWGRGLGVATSVGLAVASRHSRGRHVCVVPDERTRLEYVGATSGAGVEAEVVVGEAEEVMSDLPGVDFIVVDCHRKDMTKLVSLAKMGTKGAVVVFKSARGRGSAGIRWRGALGSGTRVLRSVYLPVGKGMEIAQVGSRLGSCSDNRSRWIKHVDRDTGEEHVFKR